MNLSTLLRGIAAAVAISCIATPALARDPNPDKCTRGNLQPGTGKDLYVQGACTVLAGTYDYGDVTIFPNGSLTFADAKTDFKAESIIVQSNGALTIGTSAAPIGSVDRDNRVTVRFEGTRSASPSATPPPAAVHNHVHPKLQAGLDDCSDVKKGIGVMAGGKLNLFGARGVAPDDGRSANIGGPNLGTVSWTYLAQPAGPSTYQDADGTKKIGAPVPTRNNATTLYVPINVSNDWRPNDWIVVSTTSFSPYETEFVQIHEVAQEGNVYKITLKDTTPLQHYHFGGPDPGRPGSLNAIADDKTNYGVDERAAVGLISRSVVLTAKMPHWRETPSGAIGDLAWGGEIKICEKFAEARIQGVELDRFGKDQLGSYPIHLHMVGDVKANTTLFNSNSIHHSYNHCVTMHMTNDVTFSNNVCARILGHIFYEEKPKDTAGTEIQLKGLKFHDNLGLGAMANLFGLDPSLPKVKINNVDVAKGWWQGDYFARTGDGYDGLNVENTDDKTLAVHGKCFLKNPNGSLGDATNPDGNKCPAGQPYYAEPPSGFWIVNPNTQIIGNSVGGCQSLGKAFWYVPPASTTPSREQLKFQPVGKFVNNRAHACYDGVFGETDTGINSEQLFPKVGGNLVNQNLIARFDAFTAFRIRNRGVWMRPTWFVFENARVATTRDAVTLVTSGGLDGNAPGVWGLLKNSTIVGVSKNNVERWGPCPNANSQEGPGCVDWNPLSLTINEKGYPSPAWNYAGFYIYDGPARIHDTRFVNFHINPGKLLLTKDDAAFLAGFKLFYNQATKFEGDAALGWFQNNQSAYPTATDVRGLKWDSVELRHQVFTEKVNFGQFDDGDKNTAIIDRDGSLTGFKLAKSGGGDVHDDYPISLNNLPFNSAANAVDECLAQGEQDRLAENRPTSLISPANYGTLEFEAFKLPNGEVPPPPPVTTPPTFNRLTQLVTFTRDMVDYGKHQTMTLHSRNNQGIWEPKVSNKQGYTITAQDATEPRFADQRRDPGMPKTVALSINDIVMPNMSTANPFYVRVGVCYTNKDGTFPDATFEIKRGYRSWGGNGVDPNDLAMRKNFIMLDQQFPYVPNPGPETRYQRCFNLASQTPDILNDTVNGCPATGIYARDTGGSCTAGGTPTKDRNNQDVCAFPPTMLAKADALSDISKPDGTYKDLDKYFYDKTSGMLFFYVMQDRPNARGSTPLGSCTGGANDPACPNPNDGTYPESYYTCPPEGCPTYVVRMSSSTQYDPGKSACGGSTEPTAIYTVKPAYRQLPLTGENQLAFVGTDGNFQDGSIVQAVDAGSTAFPHRVAQFGGKPAPPICKGAPSPPTTQEAAFGATPTR